MSALKNPRHERLAQEKAKGTPRSDALEIVGLSTRAGSSVRLWHSPKIEDRAAEINGIVVGGVLEAMKLTLQGQIEKAERVFQRAFKIDQMSSAVAALTLQSRLAGFLHDKPAAPAGDTYNIAFIKAPPQETFEQFNERRTRQLRLVGTSARPTNGSGGGHLVS